MPVPETMATVFKSVASGTSLAFFGCSATKGHQSDQNFGCSVVCTTMPPSGIIFKMQILYTHGL